MASIFKHFVSFVGGQSWYTDVSPHFGNFELKPKTKSLILQLTREAHAL